MSLPLDQRGNRSAARPPPETINSGCGNNNVTSICKDTEERREQAAMSDEKNGKHLTWICVALRFNPLTVTSDPWIAF